VKLRRFAIPVPGADRYTLIRLFPLLVMGMLAFGPPAVLVITVGFLFFQRITRSFGVPVRNEAVDAESNGNLALGIFGAGALCFAALMGQQAVLTLVIFMAMIVVAVRPAALVGLILFGAAIAGGPLLLIAVPVVVVLARREQGRQLGLRSSVSANAASTFARFHTRLSTNKIEPRLVSLTHMLGRGAATVAAAALGYLLAQPFLDAAAGEASASQQRGGPDPASPGAIERLLQRLISPDGQPGQASRGDQWAPSRPFIPEEAERSIPWLLLLGVAVALIVLVALVWAWLRSRSAPAGVEARPAGPSLHRLETVAASIGQKRKPSEGALTFAGRLATLTGDKRLTAIGPSLSRDTYQQSDANHRPELQAGLTSIETAPPPPPPRPSVVDRVKTFASTSLTWTGIAQGVAGIAALAFVGWFGLTQVESLGESSNDLLSAESSTGFPVSWQQFQALDPGELIGWESCSAVGSSVTTWNSGVVHTDNERSMMFFGYASDDQYGAATAIVRSGQEESTGYARRNHRSLTFEGNAWFTGQPRTLIPADLDWTVADVLTLANTREVVKSRFVDRNGDVFERYESLPTSLTRTEDESVPFNLPASSYQGMWVLDVWQQDGVITRVRTMIDGTSASWKEWRRVDPVAGTMPTLPNCSEVWPYANDDWIGREQWTATRLAPRQIAVDGDGIPYDTQRDTALPETVEQLSTGSIEGPINRLEIGDLYSVTISQFSPTTDAQFGLTVDWPAGAEVSHIEADGTPVLTLLTKRDGQSVASWGRTQAIEISRIGVVSTTGRFDPIDEPTLDTLLDPLWQGSDLETVNYDGTGGDDLAFLKQSDASVLIPGRDAGGAIVAVAIWNDDYAWRLLDAPEPVPPSVSERESQLGDCLSGTREFDPTGRCR